MDAIVTAAELSQFNVLSKTWLSETEYISDEIRFLKNQVYHHTTFLSDERYLESLQQMSKELIDIEKKTQDVRENIQRQLHRLHNVSADKAGSASIRNSHGILEEQIALLTKKFRDIKDSVLKLAAELLEKKPDTE